MSEKPTFEIGAQRLSIEQVVAVAAGHAQVALSDDPASCARIAAGAQYLERLLANGGTVYGVTTCYGDSCTVAVPAELVAQALT